MNYFSAKKITYNLSNFKHVWDSIEFLLQKKGKNSIKHNYELLENNFQTHTQTPNSFTPNNSTNTNGTFNWITSLGSLKCNGTISA